MTDPVQPAQSDRFRLVGSVGSTALDFALPEGETTVGRVPDNGIVIDAPEVSRHHARLTVTGARIAIADLGSTNGTYVNGERITSTDLVAGDQIRFGSSVRLELMAAGVRAQTVIAASADGTMLAVPEKMDRNATQLIQLSPAVEPAAPTERGVVGPDILNQPVISESQLREHGVEVQEVTFLGLGAGIGTFQWADLLRVSGVPMEQIAVVGTEQQPYARYQRLCTNSQIPPYERLRSNSDSRPDNVWGFPSYATREILHDLRSGDVGQASRKTWQIIGEPAFVQTFTPRSGDVFAAIDREAARIGWTSMLRFGRIRAIRKSAEGRLVVIASASSGEHRRHFAIAANYVHMAIGYPAIQLLPDLAAYREKYSDRERVVNAYEDHHGIYDQLRAKGGTIVLRGRGIVASRIIQRLYEERKHNPKIFIVHLHRSRLTEGHTYGRSRRGIENEFEFQPFNWPKGAWTGQHRVTLEAASPEERKSLLEAWGGTTTADRRDWRRIVREGVREGWYRPEYGVVEGLSPTDDGKVSTRIANALAGGGHLDLTADFVVDCTGLIASPDRSPLLDDLIGHHQLPKNPLGRLQVTNDFEITGMRHGNARMYASGATTLGGPHAAVDSFLGVQYAAYRSVESIRRGFPQGVRKLNGLYSIRQWSRWARGVTP